MHEKKLRALLNAVCKFGSEFTGGSDVRWRSACLQFRLTSTPFGFVPLPFGRVLSVFECSQPMGGSCFSFS